MTKPFDPTDDFDAACEQIRRALTDTVIAAHAGEGAFARLTDREQLGAVLCGGASGLVGCLLSMTAATSHDDVMSAIADYLPTARSIAESVTREGLH